MVKIVCWNIAHRHAAWRFLLGCEADVALLQETVLPPEDVAGQVKVDRRRSMMPMVTGSRGRPS